MVLRKRIKMVFLSALILWNCGIVEESECDESTTNNTNCASKCDDTNCEDYTSRQEAQKAFERDRVCRGDLDKDNDGIACEEPGNSVRKKKPSSPINECKDTNCEDYTSRQEAQKAFDRDRVCRGDLDKDNDGIACEEPGNSVRKKKPSPPINRCPKTASCGCSQYRKKECGGSCCEWVVGDGCGCR